MQYLTLGLGSLEEGLIYAIMAVGIFVSFRILDIPDLTVDGSFITGSAGLYIQSSRCSRFWRASSP